MKWQGSSDPCLKYYTTEVIKDPETLQERLPEDSQTTLRKDILRMRYFTYDLSH